MFDFDVVTGPTQPPHSPAADTPPVPVAVAPEKQPPEHGIEVPASVP